MYNIGYMQSLERAKNGKLVNEKNINNSNVLVQGYNDLNDEQQEVFAALKNICINQELNVTDLIFYLVEPEPCVVDKKVLTLFNSLTEEKKLQLLHVFISWVMKFTVS